MGKSQEGGMTCFLLLTGIIFSDFEISSPSATHERVVSYLKSTRARSSQIKKEAA